MNEALYEGSGCPCPSCQQVREKSVKDKAVKDYIDNLHESFDALSRSLESLIKAMRAMNQRITNLERQVSER